MYETLTNIIITVELKQNTSSTPKYFCSLYLYIYPATFVKDNLDFNSNQNPPLTKHFPSTVYV